MKIHDAENKKASWVDTSSRANRDAVSNLMRNKINYIHTFCKHNKIDIIQINTKDGYMEPLVKFFNSRLRK